jgi:FixJ family two-component response regulator
MGARVSPDVVATPTIYIVDDDPSVRTAVRRLLVSIGMRCEVYGSVPEFLTSIESGSAPYGCLILDMRMPGPSGLDLQRLLAREENDIPIIFISAYADVPTTVRAMKGGALEVLTKPFNDQALIDAVNAGVDLARRRFEEREKRAELRARFETLTARERDVMRLVVTGMLNKQVGAALGTTEKTIKAHRAQVMDKMHANSLAELVRMADRLDLLKPS